MDQLLTDERVLGHEFVYGELLVSDRGGRAGPLSTYALLTHAKTIPHVDVVRFVRARSLFGRVIGWVDAHLLASAIAADALLYSSDRALRGLADELHVAFDSEL